MTKKLNSRFDLAESPYGIEILPTGELDGIPLEKCLKTIVEADVTEVSYNNDFIIAVQQPNYQILLRFIKDTISSRIYKESSKSYLEGSIFEKRAEEMAIKVFRNNLDEQKIFSRHLCYWIIL